MRRLVLVLAAFFALSPFAFASQPGQPLDCSDWVFCSISRLSLAMRVRLLHGNGISSDASPRSLVGRNHR